MNISRDIHTENSTREVLDDTVATNGGIEVHDGEIVNGDVIGESNARGDNVSLAHQGRFLTLHRGLVQFASPSLLARLPQPPSIRTKVFSEQGASRVVKPSTSFREDQ